jgi:hypothetical protein
MTGGYGLETREEILDGLADGKSLRAICRQPGMPSVTTVLRWLQSDEEWRVHYARAREAGDDAMAEDIQAIADEDGKDPQDKRVRIDARKWLLAKRQPKKYGDRQLIGSDPDNPLPEGFKVSFVGAVKPGA